MLVSDIVPDIASKIIANIITCCLHFSVLIYFEHANLFANSTMFYDRKYLITPDSCTAASRDATGSLEFVGVMY